MDWKISKIVNIRKPLGAIKNQIETGGKKAGRDDGGPARGAASAGSARAMLRGYAARAAVLAVVAIVLELGMFNYSHWHAPEGPEMTAANYAVSPLDGGGRGGANPDTGGDAEEGPGEGAGEDAGAGADAYANVYADGGSTEGGAPGAGAFRVALGRGLEETSYGTFLITKEDRAYFEISDINAHVDNLYLHLSDPASPAVYYAIQFTDGANGNLRDLDEKAVVSGVPESRYVQLHLTGVTRTLRIYLHAREGEEIHVRRIRLNVAEPLIVHPGRIALLWILGMLLVIFGPRSWIYATRLDFRERRQRLLVLVIVFLNIFATSFAGRAADPDVWRELRDERDYQEKEYELYAEALLQGRAYLDIRPPRYLTRMRNPYDRTQRNEVAYQNDEKVLWDAAYYNGRYYVYFGIVPALLSFVPYRLLTGHALPTWRAVLSMALVLWPLSFYFIYILVRKYFKKTSFGIYLLLSWAFVPGIGVLYLVAFPVVYSVPFIYGLVFTVAGLSLWMRGFGPGREAGAAPGQPPAANSASPEDVRPPEAFSGHMHSGEMPAARGGRFYAQPLQAHKKSRVHRSRLAVGSLCIALTLGCRPTMILTCLLAFPIFWEEIRAGRFFLPKKESILNTAAVVAPFLPVGLLQMTFNKARFGSVFDFGADYNLTVTDLTKKTFSIAKNIPALFQELFQPLHIEPRFPFLAGIEVATDYQGYMFIDKMIGGFFMLNMLAIFCFWIFRIRKKMAARRVFGLAAMAFGLAALLIELDVQIGGISQRYMIDYGWLLMLAAILAILTILDDTNDHGYYAYLKALIILAALCIGVNYLSVFSDGQAISVREYNPELFYRIRYLLLPS